MAIKSTIGLIAVWGEAKPLLKFAEVKTTSERLQARFHNGTLFGHDIILAEVGPGKVQTAAVTQHLVDHYEIGLVMSCGSAGALDRQLQVGDVILADKVVLHDAGIQTNKGFRYLGIYDNTHPGGLHYHRYLVADASLLTKAHQAAVSVEWPKTTPSVQTGCLASGDQVIASESKKGWLAETFQAIAVEMESGAMAQVAFLNNIPWLAIRGISDQADSALDLGLENMITYSDEPSSLPDKIRQSTGKAAQLAKRPSQVVDLLQIRQAIKQAAYNAAQVAAEVIKVL